MVEDEQVEGYVEIGFRVFRKQFNCVAYEVVKWKLNNAFF